MSDQVSTTASTGRLQWVARWFFVALALVAFVGATVTTAQHINDRRSALSQAQGELDQLRMDVGHRKAQADADREQALRDAGGQDAARKRSDDEVANRLFTTALTWSDGKAYVAARGLVSREFGIPEDSQFMTTFLPGPEQGAYRIGSDGQVYFAASGINSTMGGFESSLVGVDHGDRSYFGRVRSETKSPAGASVYSVVAVMYTVDEEGQIKDLRAYPAHEDPNSSN